MKALSLQDSLARKRKYKRSSKIAVEFKGSCLKQFKATFTHRNVVTLFIVYKLDTRSKI